MNDADAVVDDGDLEKKSHDAAAGIGRIASAPKLRLRPTRPKPHPEVFRFLLPKRASGLLSTRGARLLF